MLLEDPVLGEKIDRDMKEAVLTAERALMTPYSESVFDDLAGAINKARSCFEHWGLASGEMSQHLQYLINHGAYAVKPTRFWRRWLRIKFVEKNSFC